MPNPPTYNDLKRTRNKSFQTKSFKIAPFFIKNISVPTPPPVQVFTFSSMVDQTVENYILPVRSFYTVSYIRLEVTGQDYYYTIDQLGDTQNPNLTCYRGTNYRFIFNQNEHPFALRLTSNDVNSEIPGAFNNNPNLGITSSAVYFTPNEQTPDTIVYQCTIHPAMSGLITIKNYE